jgi:hypothetical protein
MSFLIGNWADPAAGGGREENGSCSAIRLVVRLVGVGGRRLVERDPLQENCGCKTQFISTIRATIMNS